MNVLQTKVLQTKVSYPAFHADILCIKGQRYRTLYDNGLLYKQKLSYKQLISRDRGSDPSFAKKGDLPLENYITHMNLGHFRHIFLHCLHLNIFILNTSITVEKNLRVKISTIEDLWQFENCQKIESRMSSFFLLIFQFPRFLNAF